jgi:hypothetical protein
MYNLFFKPAYAFGIIMPFIYKMEFRILQLKLSYVHVGNLHKYLYFTAGYDIRVNNK